MANINEILARAAALRDETALNSISPERAGSIMYDTLIALNELWLQQGAALVINKIYASVAAMEADTNPVSDISGKPLRPGQIVVIASSDSDNGSVYRYNGADSPSWSLVGEIGNLDPVDNLESDSTSLPLAAHQGKVLDGKISQLGQKLYDEIYEGGIEVYGSWERGGINVTTGIYDDTKYRIRTAQKVMFRNDISVKVAAGFNFRRIYYTNQSDTVPSSFSDIYALGTGIIPKDTWVNLMILRENSIPSEEADINYFRSQVIAQSQTKVNTDDINALKQTVPANKLLFEQMMSVEHDSAHVFDGFDTVMGIFERGSISTSTGQDADNKNRVRMKAKVLYDKDVLLMAKSGFLFNILFYANESDIAPSSTQTYVAGNKLKVPANTLFRLVIYRTNEILSETADIANFVSQVNVVNSATAENKRGIDLLEDNIKFINPRKNLFNHRFVTSGALSGVGTGGYNIVDDVTGKIIILPLPDYGSWTNGGAFLKITGLRKTEYSHRATLLDANLQNIGSYSLANSFWSWTTDDYIINLNNAGYWLAKYIAIKLFAGSEFGNKSSSDGKYVWSDEEIKAGFPDWDIVINLNFTNSISAKERKDSELGLTKDWWDESKKYCNQKFGNLYYDKTYSLSYLELNNNFNFLFASDSHIHTNGSSKRNLANMVQFGSTDLMTNLLDCIIHNGDMITGNSTYMSTKQRVIDTLVDYYDVVKESGVDYIQAVGNHDKGQDGGLNYSAALTNAESVALLKEYTKHSEDTTYEFYDYADKNIRIIKIDAFDYPLEEDSNHKVKYNLASYGCYISQTQFQWLVNALLTTPADCGVILTGHIFPNHPLINQLTQLLYALKNKQSGTVSIDLSTQSPVPPSPTFSVSYDFTEANDVKIVGVLGGHDHLDSIINTTEETSSKPNTHGINVFGIRCQMMAGYEWNTKHLRQPYTETQNCFNMCSVDLIHDKLYTYRYGVNDNLYGSDVFDIV